MQRQSKTTYNVEYFHLIFHPSGKSWVCPTFIFYPKYPTIRFSIGHSFVLLRPCTTSLGWGHVRILLLDDAQVLFTLWPKSDFHCLGPQWHADKALVEEKSPQSSSCSLAQRKHSAQFAFNSPPGRTFSRRQEHGRKSAHTAALSHTSHFQPSGPRSCWAEVKLICHQFLELRGSSYTIISKEHLIIACRR